MISVSTDEARSKFNKLLEQAATSHEPIRIKGKRRNAVLVSEEDWIALQETLHLSSIPGLSASIRKGMLVPLDKTFETPGW